MGFLKKIVGAIFGDAPLGSSGAEVKDSEGIYFYVKCSRCGAPVRVRADKRHDLQRDYDTGEYILRKEIMDGTCFSLIQATLRFSPSYNVIEREIEGGEFITWEQYQELTAPKEATEPESDTE